MKQLIFLAFLISLCLNISAQDRRVITSDSVQLFVRVKGKGTPCLYIHGGPGSGSHWLEKFSGDVLEKYFMMIYLDQRGVSRSTSPKDGNYSMDRMIKDFEEVRLALGIDSWITMGHSFGGIMQMGYSLKFPQNIRGMIMFNCSLNINETGEEVIPKACEFLGITDIDAYTDPSFPDSVKLELHMKLYRQLREKNLFWKMGYKSYSSFETMNKSFEDLPVWNKDLENVPISLEDYGLNFKTYTPGLTMPVLFFYGKSDWMVGPSQYKGVAFPNMILWGSDVGHVPFLENEPDLEKAVKTYIQQYHSEQ
jgi:proline iminopeptidase